MKRREFLKVAAGAMYLQEAARKRREVAVGKRAVKVIDAHGHFVLPEELDVVQGRPLARNVSNNLGPLVLGPDRLRVLDESGIDIQILTHQGGWWYNADRDLARRIVDVQNQKLSQWCSAHSDRFVGLASVALQHPDLAAEELDTAVQEIGVRAVAIAGYARGERPCTAAY